MTGQRDSGIQDEIRTLMGLRGFFTVAVVAVHLLPILTLLHQPAEGLFYELNSLMICVEAFYVMSGFLLTRNYLTLLARPTRAGTRQFMVLRIARVWPLHVAMLAAILAYDALARRVLGYGVEGDLGLPNILANVFLVQEVGPATVINLPSWSLSPEAGAYVAFPLLAIGLARLRGLGYRLALLLAILVAGSTTLWIRYQAIDEVNEWSHTQAWLRMATTFVAGCLLALIWSDLPERVRAWRHWGTVATVSGIATIAACVSMNLGDTFRPPVLLYPLLVLVILAASCAQGRFEAIVGGPLLHWFGTISYGIYLSHFLVLISTFAVLHRLDAGNWPRSGRAVALLAVVLLVVVTGWTAHVLIEEPARKVIRRWARPAVPDRLARTAGERRGDVGQSQETAEIRALTGLRGPASLLAVVWHTNLLWVAAFPALAGLIDFSARMAALSVDVFFVLSGFVMTYVYAGAMARLARSSVTAFWVRRVARLWPLHVVTTVAMVLGHVLLPGQGGGDEGLFSGGNIAANVAMLHEFGPFAAINLPAWSVAPEMGAYLAFPLIAATLLRVPSRWILGVTAAFVLFVGSAWIDHLYAHTEAGVWSHAIAWARLVVGFTAGCLVARVWMDLPARLRSNRSWDAVAVLSLVYVVVLALGPNRWVERGVPAWSYPFLALLVLGAAGAAGPVKAALSGRAMNYLGRISYALYLTHFPALVIMAQLLAGIGFAGRPGSLQVAILAAVAAVLLVIAGLTHRFLEEPARRWFRWRLGAGSLAWAPVSAVRRGSVAP